MSTAQEHIARGLTALAQDRFDEALAAFGEAAALEPENDQAWMGAAVAHERAGRVDEAITAIQRAIALRPHEALHYTTLSRLYQRKGLKREAEDAMARSFRLSADEKA